METAPNAPARPQSAMTMRNVLTNPASILRWGPAIMTLFAMRFALFLPVLLILTACASGPKQPAPEAAVKAPRKAAGVNPDDLMGKEAAELRRLLGEPSLLRREKSAEVWQYAGETCVLFLYLYPAATGNPSVSFIDARAKTKGPASVPDCLGAALRAHGGGNARPS